MKSAHSILDFVKAHADEGFTAFSVDVKDMYYLRRHIDLLKCAESSINELEALKFSSEAGISVVDFSSLLKFLLSSASIYENSAAITAQKKVGRARELALAHTFLQS